MSACGDFRRALADQLSGAGQERVLGWHEHLLSCGACRELLEAEEALDDLLASLPEPRLPEDLLRRVLARLVAERSDLDRLLDRDPEPRAPTGLAGRVLRALEPERGTDPASGREAALDRLLDLVPAPEAPPDLARDLLARLAPVRRRPRFRVLPRLGLALAAAACVALLLRAWRAEEDVGPGTGSVAVSDEVLEELELLEVWDLVASDDLDLLLDDLDVAELTLIEHGLDEEEEDEG